MSKAKHFLKIQFASLIAFFMSIVLCAQTPAPNAMPTIVPPSPELASLAKLGSLSAGLHTGSANVNIPLYDLSNGSIKIPVALSYSSNGIKVTDISNRVGMGWNLIAGGMVSRVIHDEDDLSPEVQHPSLPASLLPSDNNSALYTYLLLANMDDVDTEKDEYSFSVNGMSGKFFFDDNGVPRQVEHSNVKIEKSGDFFIITDANGTQYYFGEGGNVEKTRGYLTNGTGRWDRISTTGWFLTRIVSVDGRYINFNYNSLFIKSLRGPSQTMTVKPSGETGTGNPCPNCDPICAGMFGYPSMNQIDYDTKKLESITTSNGVQVYFVYENRGDIGNDVMLKQLTVQQITNENSVQLKNYEFEYESFFKTGDWNKRYFLKKVYSKAGATSPEGSVIADNTSQIHQFEYDDPAGLPSQKSYDQDYYGYANSSIGNNNFYFAPRMPHYQYYPEGSLLANREPNILYMKKGLLKKVIYPTGGSESFNYEQHTLPEEVMDRVFATTAVSGVGASISSPVTDSRDFTINTNRILKVNLTTSLTPGQTSWLPEDAHYLADVTITRLSDNVNVGYMKTNVYNSKTMVLDFNSGIIASGSYRVTLKVFGAPTSAIAQVLHSPVITPRWQNNPVCGVRLQSIESFDPVSNKTSHKFYKYAAIGNLNVSSGKGVGVPIFSQPFAAGGMCLLGSCGNGIAVWQVECINSVQVSSSSLSQLPDYGGSPVAYKDVIESDDASFINGAVHHNFYTLATTAGVNVPIFGPGIFTAPTGNWPNMNGRELTTSYYKMANSQLQLTKKVENTYNLDSRVSYTRKSYLHRQRWYPFPVENASFYGMPHLLRPFDMVEYIDKSGWIHLDNTLVTEYDADGLNPMTSVTTYEYANVAHTMPTRITTTGSKGETIVQEARYPADYATTPYTTMVGKNILATTIEKKTLRDGNVMETITTPYLDWFSDGKILKPVQVNMKKAANIDEPRLRYYALDNLGNVTEVAKENDIHSSYIWDYAKSLPIAEAKNAAVADIAFSSFETSASGGWSINGSVLPVGSTDLNNFYTYYDEGLTGGRSFGGKLTRAINAGTSYFITLWSKATAAAPTVNTQTGMLLLTKNNWKLYKWVISGTNLATVQGNQIDELRLHPATALMTSYTYFPHIGINSVTDAANTIQYYEYDGFGRLLIVRDIDRNIIKQYNYKIGQTIAPCGSTVADWQLTGITRCVVNSNGNYTGEKEAQERNENNCSAGFLDNRWVPIITPVGECVPIPGCTGVDKRVVAGSCETGVKTLVSSQKISGVWHCTYRYVWSDGFHGNTFVETGTVSCLPLVDF